MPPVMLSYPGTASRPTYHCKPASNFFTFRVGSTRVFNPLPAIVLECFFFYLRQYPVKELVKRLSQLQMIRGKDRPIGHLNVKIGMVISVPGRLIVYGPQSLQSRHLMVIFRTGGQFVQFEIPVFQNPGIF